MILGENFFWENRDIWQPTARLLIFVPTHLVRGKMNKMRLYFFFVPQVLRAHVGHFLFCFTRTRSVGV